MLWTSLRNKDFHLAAELQPCSTDRLIDLVAIWIFGSALAKTATLASVTERTSYR
jgi:hypothetical protein